MQVNIYDVTIKIILHDLQISTKSGQEQIQYKGWQGKHRDQAKKCRG